MAKSRINSSSLLTLLWCHHETALGRTRRSDRRAKNLYSIQMLA